MCRSGEHGGGEESCVAGRKGFALPVCKPPPGCRPGGGQVVPVVSSGCRCRPFPPDFAGKTPAAGVLSFPYCPNMERNVPIFASSLSFRPLSVFDLTISAGFGCFVGSGCRLPDGQGMEPGRPPPLAVAVGQLFSPEHRPPSDSSSLPSPLLFFGRRRLPLAVCVLFCCSPSPAVPLGSLVVCWWWLYTGVYFIVFNRARN